MTRRSSTQGEAGEAPDMEPPCPPWEPGRRNVSHHQREAGDSCVLSSREALPGFFLCRDLGFHHNGMID